MVRGSRFEVSGSRFAARGHAGTWARQQQRASTTQHWSGPCIGLTFDGEAVVAWLPSVVDYERATSAPWPPAVPQHAHQPTPNPRCTLLHTSVDLYCGDRVPGIRQGCVVQQLAVRLAHTPCGHALPSSTMSMWSSIAFKKSTVLATSKEEMPGPFGHCRPASTDTRLPFWLYARRCLMGQHSTCAWGRPVHKARRTAARLIIRAPPASERVRGWSGGPSTPCRRTASATVVGQGCA